MLRLYEGCYLAQKIDESTFEPLILNDATFSHPSTPLRVLSNSSLSGVEGCGEHVNTFGKLIHCYEAVLKHFPEQITMLSLLPLSMRMAGARESLWYGIIHQNYGCTHFIVGPNHALPPLEDGAESGYEAQRLIEQHEQELDIKMIPVEEYQYMPNYEYFSPVSKIKKKKENGLRFSERKIREHLHVNKPIPKWCSYPEVIQEMEKAYPARSKQGFTLFFTGLSGSGKSTIAKIVNAQLIEHGTRPVTLLDGDVVRLNLSSELGFSKPHRDLNIRRIGFVANEITKNKGLAICAPIAPYTKRTH